MPFPPQVDTRIRTTLDKLIQESLDLAVKMRSRSSALDSQARASGFISSHPFIVLETDFERVRFRVLSVLALLGETATHLQDAAGRVASLEAYAPSMDQIAGILQGLKADYENGFLDRLSRIVEGQIVADYLAMAEERLTGDPVSRNHIPAAVLGGAVLEDALRRICQRNNPPISTAKSNGELKSLNPLIDDLKSAGVFNELKAKQLRAWADIRNAAAHGHFDEFGEHDVAQMLQGISQFLADHL